MIENNFLFCTIITIDLDFFSSHIWLNVVIDNNFLFSFPRDRLVSYFFPFFFPPFHLDISKRGDWQQFFIFLSKR